MRWFCAESGKMGRNSSPMKARFRNHEYSLRFLRIFVNNLYFFFCVTKTGGKKDR
jgi:hypothetical protein